MPLSLCLHPPHLKSYLMCRLIGMQLAESSFVLCSPDPLSRCWSESGSDAGMYVLRAYIFSVRCSYCYLSRDWCYGRMMHGRAGGTIGRELREEFHPI